MDVSIVELAIDAAGHVGDVARHQRPTVAQAARQRWTQAALGALLGVAQPTVASWLPVNGGDNARIISADNPSKSAPDGETLDGDGGEQELEPTPLEEAVAQAESRTSGSAASLDTEAISMTETTLTSPKLQTYTVTADVLLTLETEAGSPAEALEHYQAFRREHLELHGRGGVTVLLPADLPAVVTTERWRCRSRPWGRTQGGSRAGSTQTASYAHDVLAMLAIGPATAKMNGAGPVTTRNGSFHNAT